MILKRNISTFAAVLGLMAIMLLSASPAQAFKTTNPDMAAAYDQCLTINFQGKAKNVKKCFEDIRTTYAERCVIDNALRDRMMSDIDSIVRGLRGRAMSHIRSAAEANDPQPLFDQSEYIIIETVNDMEQRLVGMLDQLFECAY